MKTIDQFFMYVPLHEMVQVRFMPSWTGSGVFAGLPYRTTWVHFIEDEKGAIRIVLCPHFSSRDLHREAPIKPCAICETREALYLDATQSYKWGNIKKSEMIDRVACSLTACEVAIYQVVDIDRPLYGRDSEKDGRPFVQLLYMDVLSHTRLLNIFLERQRSLEFDRGLVFSLRRNVQEKKLEPLQDGTLVIRFNDEPHNLFGGHEQKLRHLEQEVYDLATHPLFTPPTYEDTQEYIAQLKMFQEEEVPAQKAPVPPEQSKKGKANKKKGT